MQHRTASPLASKPDICRLAPIDLARHTFAHACRRTAIEANGRAAYVAWMQDTTATGREVATALATINPDTFAYLWEVEVADYRVAHEGRLCAVEGDADWLEAYLDVGCILKAREADANDVMAWLSEWGT